MRTIFDEAERERLAALDPAEATVEDQAALCELLAAQIEELHDGIDRLRASHDRLLAAAKEALDMINDGYPLDAWIPLEAAFATDEESAQ